MRCPRCGSDDVDIIDQKVTTKGGYDTSMGICGAVLLGPTGLLCGLCGDNKKTSRYTCWVCDDCGHRWGA